MKTKQPSVTDRLIQHHADLAATAFKDHVATMRLDHGMFRSWRCQRPGSWCYGFDVTTTPGDLIIAGDIGDLVVSRTEDMIAWARGSIRDPHYFAEKVPHSIPTEEWSYDKSLEWIDETIADADECYGDADEAAEAKQKLAELREALESDGINGQMSEHEFSTALYESDICDGCDWPNLKVFNSNFLWCREAVKWLLGAIERSEGRAGA